MPKLKVSADDLKPLLVTRKQTAALLACSLSTVIELEQMKRLTTIKLTQSTASVVHHRLDEAEKLARGETTTDTN